jgi:hemolysin activation/secretion protein
VTWLGAEIAADLPDGSPNSQYSLVGFSADYARDIGPEGSGLRWTSTASGQYSSDRLYGDQSFSIGGVSTVRGSKISLATGSSGILWRNELEYAVPQTAINSVALYGALDVGHVFAQPAINILSATAVGGAVGLKLRDDNYTFDVSYQKILSVSEGLQQPEGQFLMSLEIIF